MLQERKLLAVLAHPDDESLGFGGTLAKYAAEGVETHLVTATRGERGRFGAAGKTVDPEIVGRVREAELRAAANTLGIRTVAILGYPDGGVDRTGTAVALRTIAEHIRRIRPQVVLTFGPEGAYGHPDHIAISQLTTAAVVVAADADFPCGADATPAYSVPKLYYLAWPSEKWNAYQAAFRQLTCLVDGIVRQATPWPDWAVTTRIDTAAHWPVVWKAVSCHETQLSIYGQLEQLTDQQQSALWGTQEFYRAYSCVNSGREIENCLFEGLG